MKLHLFLTALLAVFTLADTRGDVVDEIPTGAGTVGDPKAFPTNLRLLKGVKSSSTTPRKRSKKGKKGSPSKGKLQLPAFVKSFKKATFVPGGQKGFEDTVEEEDGIQYRVIANITTFETGIVSLAGASSLLREVKCFDDGTVRITFNELVRGEFLAAMFPLGSMLVIDGATLGSCLLGVDEGEEQEKNYWTDHFPDSTDDGYLFIEEAVIGASGSQAVVRGSRSSFFFMFDEADFIVEPIPSNDFHVNGTVRDRELQSVEKSFTAKKEFPKGKSPLKVKAKVSFLVFAGLSGFHANWKFLQGITLSVTFDYELTTLQELGVYLSKGTQRQNKAYPLINYPLFGIPTIPLLKRLKLTSPKLGAYIEVDYFIEYALKISAGASAVATNAISTGRKKLEFYVKGGWSGLSAGVRKKTNRKAKKNGASFDVSVPRALTAEAEVFTGIQPGVWLYLFGLGRAGVFQRSGLELDAVASTSGLAPTKKNGATLGPCKACHNFRAKVDLVVENLSYEFSMRFKFKVNLLIKKINIDEKFKRVGTLPGKLRADLFTACALERKGETPCKSKCCKKGFKCIGGACRKVVTTKKPVKAPTKSPTKSPTNPPIIIH
jgi:hypothetical protein